MLEKHKKVVPYVGTWIEMQTRRQTMTAAASRSLRGNVDRNIGHSGITWSCKRRSLRGNVDRNTAKTATPITDLRRSLRGNVDRNVHLLHHCQLAFRSFPTWERG